MPKDNIKINRTKSFALPLRGKCLIVLFFISAILASLQIGLMVISSKFKWCIEKQSTTFLVLGFLEACFCVVGIVLNIISGKKKNVVMEIKKYEDDHVVYANEQHNRDIERKMQRDKMRGFLKGAKDNTYLMKIRFKTIAYLLMTSICILYIVIYYTIFKNSHLENTIVNEKTKLCSEHGCENMLWFATPSFFFVLIFSYQMFYNFCLTGTVLDSILQLVVQFITLYPLFYLLFIVIFLVFA